MLRSYLQYKPVYKQILIFLAILLLFFVVAQFSAVLIVNGILGLSFTDAEKIANGDFSHPLSREFLMGVQAFTVIIFFVGTAYTYAKLANHSATKYLHLHRFDGKFIGYVILLVFISLPVVGALGQINSYLPLPDTLHNLEQKSTKAVEFLAKGKGFFNFFISVLVIGFFAAVTEELVFRGVLQRIIIKGVKKPIIGIIITAFVFSAFHMQFKGLLPRMFLGVVLGYIYWYSRSLWLAIFFHFLYNSLGVTAMSFVDKSKLDKMEKASNTDLIILFCVATVAFIGFVLIIKQLKKQSDSTYIKWYPTPTSAFERDV